MSSWFLFAVALEDGLNPCALLTCAVFLMMSLWISPTGLHRGKFLFVFFLVVLILNFVFSLGFLSNLLAIKWVIRLFLSINFLLGLFFACAGAVFVYDWFLACRGKSAETLLSTRIFSVKEKKVSGIFVSLAVVAAGAVMSFLSTVWPPNYVVSLTANNLYLPGRCLGTFFSLGLYSFIQLWFLLLLLALIAGNILTPRMRQMINAAVFFCAAGAVMYLL